MNLSRRKFLIASGWIAAGVTVVFSGGCSLPVLPTLGDDAEDDAINWLQLLPDGNVRFYIGKAEMGQGISTALSQIVAEELLLPMEMIEPVLADTNLIPPVRMTVGSETVQTLYQPLRQASADLLAALRQRAAMRHAVDITEVYAADGGFVLANSNAVIPYSALAAEDTLIVKSHQGKPRAIEQYAVIGKSQHRVDTPAKLNGTALYAHDIYLPDMLYGKVLHPPVFGARLTETDSRQAQKMRGVVKVVESLDDGFIGVICESPEIADTALRSIKTKWHIPKQWQQSEVESLLDPMALQERGIGSHGIVDAGSIDDGKRESVATIQRRCWTPFAAHAPMETPAGVAHVTDDKVELWVGSQDVFFHRTLTAKLTSMAQEKVIVHPLMIGGAFGGKVYVEAADEAVILSRAVKRPVKVVWSREESFQRGYFRTASAHLIDAGVNSQGNISYWHHQAASGPVIFSPSFMDPVAQWATSFFKDKGGVRGLSHPYSIANQRVAYWDEPLPVPTGPWRGLNSSINNFAIETTMDALARAANKDPLKFRLDHLSGDQPRLRQVLRVAAKAAGWGKAMEKGQGRGISCGIYKGSTFVAVVAEVNTTGGKIEVKRLVCAHDCGLVINPDGVKAQIEGNLVWGCGTALKEELTVVDGRMSADNFHAYQVIRYDEVPQIEVHLIEDKSNPPSGAGEPALMPTPAAIANAVAMATGRDVTRLPIRQL